ncbi:beta-lactamase family protein [bacterium]|nr:beta-lactamase family protein [bacterium]
MRPERFNAFSSIIPFAAGILVIILTGCSSDDSPTQPAAQTVLETQLAQLVEQNKIPGAAGIAVSHDKVVELRAHGLRRAGRPDTVTVHDLFHVGSLVKPMTATMLATLVDSRALAWDSRPADIIPELAPTLDPGYSGITLLDLLHHRAGVPSDDDITEVPTLSGSLAEQRLQATQILLAMPPVVSRGTFRYSNAGYMIAGCMAEVTSGQDWRALMESRLFGPLSMSVFHGWPTQHDPAEPWGHTQSGDNFQAVDPSVDPPEFEFLEPAGWLSMSLSDLGKFMQLHLDALQGSPRLVSQAAFDILHAPVDNYYACGFVVQQSAGGKFLWHNGSNTYFYVIMGLLPEKNLGVAIAVNAGGDQVQLAVDQALNLVLAGMAGK